MAVDPVSVYTYIKKFYHIICSYSYVEFKKSSEKEQKEQTKKQTLKCREQDGSCQRWGMGGRMDEI